MLQKNFIFSFKYIEKQKKKELQKLQYVKLKTFLKKKYSSRFIGLCECVDASSMK